METATILTGLGYGDCGKGTTADWFCHNQRAHTVIRTGGPQALHTVVTAHGLAHTFRHFGSGTLRGARTHLSRQMVVDPQGLIDQGQALIELGIGNAFDLLTIDEHALIITPFHSAANQLRELGRGARRHGTVGLGVGETILEADAGMEAIHAQNLTSPDLADKLAAIQKRKHAELLPVIESLGKLTGVAAEAAAALAHHQVVLDAVTIFQALAKRVQIVDGAYLGEILAQPGRVVFEPSQGMLLDRWFGFHPHTTKARVGQDAALELLEEFAYQGEIERLGIIRAYHTRHGAGPFVSEDADLTARLPDTYNVTHPWQGSFRVGQLDLVSLRYAIAASGGPAAFDGLVVTCLDRLVGLPAWQVCDSYTYRGSASLAELDQFFILDAGLITEVRVRPNSRDQEQLAYQERLGQHLFDCQPNLYPIERSYEALLSTLAERVGLPIALTSFGPTERDKRDLRSAQPRRC